MDERTRGRSYQSTVARDSAVVLQGDIYPNIVYIIVNDENIRYRRTRQRARRHHRGAQCVEARPEHSIQPLQSPTRHNTRESPSGQSDGEGYDASSESEILQSNFRTQLNGRVRRALRLPPMSRISFQSQRSTLPVRGQSSVRVQTTRAMASQTSSTQRPQLLIDGDPILLTLYAVAMSSFAGSGPCTPYATIHWVFKTWSKAQAQAQALLVVYSGGFEYYMPTLSVPASPSTLSFNSIVFEDAFGQEARLPTYICANRERLIAFFSVRYGQTSVEPFVKAGQFNLMLGSRKGPLVHENDWSTGKIQSISRVVMAVVVRTDDFRCLGCKSWLLPSALGEYECLKCRLYYENYDTLRASSTDKVNAAANSAGLENYGLQGRRSRGFGVYHSDVGTWRARMEKLKPGTSAACLVRSRALALGKNCDPAPRAEIKRNISVSDQYAQSIRKFLANMSNDDSEDLSDGGVELLTPQQNPRGASKMVAQRRSGDRFDVPTNIRQISLDAYNKISDDLRYVDLEVVPLTRISKRDNHLKVRRSNWLHEDLKGLRWQIKICENAYLDLIESVLWSESSQLWSQIEALWTELDIKQKELQLLSGTNASGEKGALQRGVQKR